MANTIAHLMVAHRLYMEHPEMIADCKAYYLGSVAPDTISSKPGCERNDKKFVHLRQDIRDADWLCEDKMRIFNARINDFANVFINGNPDPNQRAFNLGYLVHLLTDKWNHKTVRQKMLQIAVQNGVQESDRAFYHMMVNDLEAMDHYLLRNNEDIRALFADLTNATVECGLPGYIEKEYIERSIQWWKEYYLPSIEKRQLMYISEKDIDAFIDFAVQGIYSELLRLIADL